MSVETGAPRRQLDPRESHARSWRGLGWGFVAKLVMMALVNALGLSIIFAALNVEAWGILVGSAVLLIAADVIYFMKRTLPLKYIFPGLVFLFVFQVFTLGYTGYVAFTNYGTGHAGSMQQAVDAALIQDERRVENSPSYPLAVVDNGDELGFAVNDDGTVRVGTEEQALEAVGGAVVDEGGTPVEVEGWEIVPRSALFSDQDLQSRVVQLRVPVSDDAESGSIRTRDGASGAIYRSTLDWDPDSQTLTNTETGTVYEATDTGNFVAADGSSLPAGWVVTVGFDNFVDAVTDTNLSGPLLKVTLWTFAFAILTVLTSFGLGLLFAIIY
ncbi:MAG: maltose ABC transporter permease, partial [Demequina sp.]